MRSELKRQPKRPTHGNESLSKPSRRIGDQGRNGSNPTKAPKVSQAKVGPSEGNSGGPVFFFERDRVVDQNEILGRRGMCNIMGLVSKQKLLAQQTKSLFETRQVVHLMPCGPARMTTTASGMRPSWRVGQGTRLVEFRIRDRAEASGTWILVDSQRRAWHFPA